MSEDSDCVYYCLGCETFVPDSEVDNDVLFATHQCGAEVAVYIRELPGIECMEDGVPVAHAMGEEE
jgi:hypothetical protein